MFPAATRSALRIRLDRHLLSPSQSLATGFAVITIVGALLLQLPVASTAGERQRFADAFFTASSAVTTTGLGVVDTGTYYSLFGQLVIFALFQLGGLGYMVFIALVAFVAGQRLSVRVGITLQESIAGLERSQQREFVRCVFVYTIVCEALGALLLTLHWLPQYSVPRALYYGVFHSVSAFCTAGFALFSTSFISDRDNVLVNVTIGAVTLAGAVGFFVLRDLVTYVRMAANQQYPRRLSLHTRIVLASSLGLALAGTVFIVLLEPPELAGAAWPQRVASASFQALSASTTTGFNSVDVGAMRATSLLALIILMFIGASPGGTGGGIKTTTFAAIVLDAVAVLRGGEDAVAWRRRLSQQTVRRAVVITSLALLLVALDLLVLTVTERASFLQLLFEVTSAFATVGLSTGITGSLTVVGKWVIAITMLVGRVGPLAIGFALLSRPQHARVRYADDQLFIG